LKHVKIYTDGACSGNPGPGGYAAILIYKETEKELVGFSNDTTNNIMELTAVLEGLKYLKEKCEVTIYSDSAYVINAFEKGWIYDWKKANWTRGKKREELKNKELWQNLLQLSGQHEVTWIKVKGHSDNKYNNRCDELAVDAIIVGREENNNGSH
jgi:ribonuclease HI